MTTLYSDIDPYVVEWLRRLQNAGLIAPGCVDPRSIRELEPEDVSSATRAHFFAGIGGWDYALQLAGWPADMPVWTGSCPCQPFSLAGKGKGEADERHLWHDWFRLIRECRPPVIFGEQVASPLGRAWLSAVRSDLEDVGYAVGAADLCAAGIGAPHARQRLFFVAYSDHAGERADGRAVWAHRRNDACGSGASGCVAHTAGTRQNRTTRGGREAQGWVPRQLGRSVPSGVVGHAHGKRVGRDARGPSGTQAPRNPAWAEDGCLSDAPESPGPWDDAEWILCRDRDDQGRHRIRPAQPGTFPVAYGLPRGMGSIEPRIRRMAEVAGLSQSDLRDAKRCRHGRLAGYGNAIVPALAAAFVRAAMEAMDMVDTIPARC